MSERCAEKLNNDLLCLNLIYMESMSHFIVMFKIFRAIVFTSFFTCIEYILLISHFIVMYKMFRAIVFISFFTCIECILLLIFLIAFNE